MAVTHRTAPSFSLLLLLACLGPLAGPAAAEPSPSTSTLAASPAASASTSTLAAAPATSATQAQAAGAKKEPGFHLKPEPKDVHVGDPVTLSLEANDPAIKPDKVGAVNLDLDPEKWHVEAPFRREAASPDGKRPEAWRATVRPFDTGKLAIPPLKVAYRDAAGAAAEAQTTTATVNVLALRPSGSKVYNLIPMRDPVDIPRDWGWLWLALALLVVLGTSVWFLLRWLARRTDLEVAETEPELPPGLWALRELDHRSRLPVCQSGPAKAVFSHVSEVVRLYLGRRYGVAAIDMTTHECLEALVGIGLGDEVMRWVREFLEECDMVKFTTFEPARDRWKTIWHDARLIVKMTTTPEELGEAPDEDRERVGEVAL